MKTLLLLLSVTSAHAAPEKCANISGNFRPPYEGDDADVVTTIKIEQSGCDSITISGRALGKPHFESETRVYYPVSLSLKGAPPPNELSCLNSYPGVCASYLAAADGIVKTGDERMPLVVEDSAHGICSSSVSRLAKDAAGNLVESLVGPKCEDGFTGQVTTAVVWPKAK